MGKQLLERGRRTEKIFLCWKVEFVGGFFCFTHFAFIEILTASLTQIFSRDNIGQNRLLLRFCYSFLQQLGSRYLFMLYQIGNVGTVGR